MMSPEQKKAASERMKAYHAAKKGAVLAEVPTPAPVEPTFPSENDLQKQIDELKALIASQKFSMPQTAQVQGTKLIGRTDRFIVDPAYYADPTERLMNEPKLQRFAFKDNYDITFKVTSSSYQTQDGLNFREPKFNLELLKVVFNEETGEKTNERIVVCRAVFHEDPEAAIVIARDNGIEVDQSNERIFLDEMRYLRIRDWLLESFYPPKAAPSSEKVEKVIGNRLVEIITVNSENGGGLDWNKIQKKL